MSYIRAVEIVYGDSNDSIGGQDINKGFGGEYVYLVPKYVVQRKFAACGFSLHTSYVEDLNANDISRGDGKELYRYIHSHYKPGGPRGGKAVGDVWLSEEQEGQGCTDDLNKDRGGRLLYLCWNYRD
ncbi:hypothetical protein FISHEDRAFT_56548 [Fistulina hepatica ATCC 64428]|uniref:Uncharacterized protein n=1 Tax=Fistulina hepatica ATCC 64428 TaxID=1128425 RepID=A0A0D7AJ68_9AGAR|nr:hypothetical protein FISHEDRAFT_56548 [Fistulina hepatica ATCC 64428]